MKDIRDFLFLSALALGGMRSGKSYRHYQEANENLAIAEYKLIKKKESKLSRSKRSKIESFLSNIAGQEGFGSIEELIAGREGKSDLVGSFVDGYNKLKEGKL
jgi:hypothetical protein